MNHRIDFLKSRSTPHIFWNKMIKVKYRDYYSSGYRRHILQMKYNTSVVPKRGYAEELLHKCRCKSSFSLTFMVFFNHIRSYNSQNKTWRSLSPYACLQAISSRTKHFLPKPLNIGMRHGFQDVVPSRSPLNIVIFLQGKSKAKITDATP